MKRYHFRMNMEMQMEMARSMHKYDQSTIVKVDEIKSVIVSENNIMFLLPHRERMRDNRSELYTEQSERASSTCLLTIKALYAKFSWHIH